MAFRLTRSLVETPATSAMATMTPAIGEMARPIDDDNCMGRIMSTGFIPTFPAMPGTSGPKEKNEALPLPISMAARKMMMMIKI